MPISYDLLPENYDADTIAAAMQARQQEHYHYSLDAETFENMLKGELADGYRAEITKRLEETKARMAEVEAIYNALEARITDPEAHAAAVQRLKDKMAAQAAAQPTQ